MKKGHIFFIMWVSWAWKWTLIKNLKKQTELELDFAKSYATRPMRKWEINWEMYNFISKDDFEKSIDKWEFLEYFKVYWLTNYYWTKYKDVVEDWINNWKIVIKEVDMNGLLIIKSNHSVLKDNFSSIFLNLPLEEQIKRIEARWAKMSEIELEERKKTALEEQKVSEINCDFIIDVTNNSKEDTLKEAINIIKKVVEE